MRKLLSMCFVALTAATVFAQDNMPPASKASIAYRMYRSEITEPTYGLEKIKPRVKKLKADPDGNTPMPDKEYNALSLKEKFTYTMLHGEDASQNCDVMPVFVDEEHKIFAYPPSAFDYNEVWSKRQREFLHKNRTQVIGLIRATMETRHRAGCNIKEAISELNAWELIPDLVKLYNRDHKDQDILSLLMILMKDNKYKPFRDSASFRKLYGEDASYKAYLVANSANQKLEISRAMSFYKSKKK